MTSTAADSIEMKNVDQGGNVKTEKRALEAVKEDREDVGGVGGVGEIEHADEEDVDEVKKTEEKRSARKGKGKAIAPNTLNPVPKAKNKADESAGGKETVKEDRGDVGGVESMNEIEHADGEDVDEIKKTEERQSTRKGKGKATAPNKSKPVPKAKNKADESAGGKETDEEVNLKRKSDDTQEKLTVSKRLRKSPNKRESSPRSVRTRAVAAIWGDSIPNIVKRML